MNILLVPNLKQIVEVRKCSKPETNSHTLNIKQNKLNAPARLQWGPDEELQIVSYRSYRGYSLPSGREIHGCWPEIIGHAYTME